MEDFLHVVQIFEHVQQFLHPGGIVSAQLDGVFGAHGDHRFGADQTDRVQGCLDGFEVSGRGQHLDYAILVGEHVLRAGLQRRFHDLVFAGARGVNKLADMLELEHYRALGAHIAAVFVQGVAHFGHGAHAVVGHGVDHDGRPADAVALVADFLVGNAFLVAGGFVDVVFDAVGRHIGRLGALYGQAQARVHAQIAAASAGSDGNFADDAGPDLAPLFVLTTFTVLNIGPFAVSCHAKSFENSLTSGVNCTF